MRSGNFSLEQLRFFQNMNLFRFGKVNQTAFENLYQAIIQYLLKDNSEFSMKIYNMIQNEYNKKKFENQTSVWMTLWTMICIIGIVGNTFVITVFYRNKQHVVYEIFCIGLALTDLSFLLLTVPITILHYMLKSWVFGTFLCRFVNFISYGTLFSSAIMLLSLTASRFLSVVRPWDHRNMTLKGAISACAFAWIAGYLCSTPIAIYFTVVQKYQTSNTSNSMKRCQDHFPSVIARQIYFSGVLAFTYLIPFIGIIAMNCRIIFALRKEGNAKANIVEQAKPLSKTDFSSIRNKRQQKRRSKVTKLVIVITTTYCICWLPTHLLNVWYYTSPQTFPETIVMLYAKTISLTVSYASACINPFIYSIISQSFQSSVKTQFPKLYQIMTFIKFRGKRNIYEIEETNIEYKRSIYPKDSCKLITTV